MRATHLFARFEDITLKGIAAPVASDVTKYFQVVAIVRDVKYPETCVRILFENSFPERRHFVSFFFLLQKRNTTCKLFVVKVTDPTRKTTMYVITKIREEKSANTNGNNGRIKSHL